jgi:hypothetical protein
MNAVRGLQFNSIATVNRAAFHDSAKNPSPPTEGILKTIANFVHLMARCTGLRDLEQRIPNSKPLPQRHRIKLNSPRRDIFPRASRRNPKFIECFQVHQQNLPRASAPPVNAFLKTFIRDRKNFLKFVHRLAVCQALK